MNDVALEGFGGGGATLNFKVVGGTAQPANPSENMIWVNTDQKITSWLFSATEPTEPTEGMVWISTGTSSSGEFNALKKNGIQVYPLSAKQYVSGKWVDKTAQIWQGGEWVEVSNTLWLFKEGIGVGNGYTVNYEKITANPFTITQSSILWSNNTDYGGSFNFNPAVDLTGYSTLVVELKCTGRFSADQNFVTVGVGKNPITSHDNAGDFVASVSDIYTTSRKTYSVNVSKLTGNHYVKLGGYGVAGYVYNCYLTK